MVSSKNIKEEYKVISIDLSKYELHDINESFHLSNKAIEESEDQKLEAQTQIEVMEAGLEKEKLVVLEKERFLSDQQKALNAFLNTIQEHESEKRIAEQKGQFLNERILQLQNQISQSKGVIESLAVEIERLKTFHTEDEEKLETVRAEFEIAKVKLEEQRNTSLEFRNKLEGARDSHNQSQQRITELEKTIAVKETEYQALQKNATDSLFENEERQKLISYLQQEVAQTEEQMEKQRALVDDLKKKEEENEQKIRELEEKTEHQRQELTNKNRSLDAKNNEYKLTKNMIDNLEGFPESIKFLKINVSWLKDAPLLSDIIYSEEKYRIAIESVLQPYLNNFVVDTENEALNAIDILSKSSVGKASFLILDYFKRFHVNEARTSISNAKRALDLVQVDDKYKPLLNYLLNGIYIAYEHTDVNQAFNQLTNKENIFIISNSGHLLKSDKQISGGAVGLFEGKRLGRLKNLEILDTEIKQLDVEVIDLKKIVQDIQNELNHLKVNSFRNVIQREDYTLQQFEKELVGKRSKIESEQSGIAKLNAMSQALEERITLLQSELEPVKSELESLFLTANTNKDSLENVENDFRRANELYNELTQTFNTANIQFIQHENKLKSNQQTLLYKQIQLEENQTRSQQAEEEIPLYYLWLHIPTSIAKTCPGAKFLILNILGLPFC